MFTELSHPGGGLLSLCEDGSSTRPSRAKVGGSLMSLASDFPCGLGIFPIRKSAHFNFAGNECLLLPGD